MDGHNLLLESDNFHPLDYFAKQFIGEETCKCRIDISGYWIFKT